MNMLDESRKTKLKQLLPNYLFVLINSGKRQSEIVQKVEPILGLETSALVLWFIEILIQSSSKQKYELGVETEQERLERLREEKLQKEKARQFNQTSNIFVAVHGEKAISMVENLMNKIPSQPSLSGGPYLEDNLINYDDKKIISTDDMEQLKKQHESNPTKYPQYFSTSETNSIKNTSNINSFLNTSWFVIEDGIEELDLSEDLESSCLLQEEAEKETLKHIQESEKRKDDRNRREHINRRGNYFSRNYNKNSNERHYHRYSNDTYTRDYSNQPNTIYYPSPSTTVCNTNSLSGNPYTSHQYYPNVNPYGVHENTTNTIQQSATVYPSNGNSGSDHSNYYNFDNGSSFKRSFDNYSNYVDVTNESNNKKRKYNNKLPFDHVQPSYPQR
ncbi:hypothetical protein C9374_001258 [Naegleria lovaniensis]|uniref:Uncharacterized protein n=1 Tax=Naegleria lovaniensis TaxID=51637 RepID=A0AA88GXV4_NAELO|nr:uncharacterized protein C9374_001258 [Naegleria lovaniensis]KAG2387664.1 hypothetical protein C9374_001258 [Naegleria lovaniensis]